MHGTGAYTTTVYSLYGFGAISVNCDPLPTATKRSLNRAEIAVVPM